MIMSTDARSSMEGSGFVIGGGSSDVAKDGDGFAIGGGSSDVAKEGYGLGAHA